MKRRSKVHTNKSRLVRSYPLRLELLEDRLPPGDMVGSGLLGAAWLSASSASSLRVGEPRQSTQMFGGHPGAPTAGSPASSVAPEGRNLREGETERPVALRSVGWSSWTAWEAIAGPEMTAGPWDDPFRPMERSRSKPPGFSHPEESGAGGSSADPPCQARPPARSR